MTGTVLPDTGEVTVLMTADEAEAKTLKAQQYMGMVCHLVKELHDKQAWRALGYPSWVAYCKDRFNVGKSRSYQLIGYAETIALGTKATGLPESTIVDSLPEATARSIDRTELAELLDEAYGNLPDDTKIETRRELFDAVLDQITKDSGDGVPAPPPSDAPDDRAPAPSSGEDSDGGEPPASSSGDVPEPACTPDRDPGEAGDDTPSSAAAPGDGDGSGSSMAAPVATSPELDEAAERAAVSADMVAARRLLSRDPAAVVALLTAEDDETWSAHADDMADWSHQFFAAKTDRNRLRSV